jgi:plastocyanin
MEHRNALHGALGASVLLVASLLLSPFLGVRPSFAANAEVLIGSELAPRELSIAPGTIVTWRNGDSDRHRVRSTAGPEEFDSGNLEPGDTFAFRFSVAGTYSYVDGRNPDASAWWGTIVVEGDAKPPAAGTGSGATPSSSARVGMADRAFRPAAVTIAAGGTVVWNNDDREDHTVTARDRGFDSGVLGPGGEFPQTFPSAGRYAYICAIHPDMTGEVVVTDRSGATPAAPAAGPSPSGTGDSSPPTATMVDFDFSPPTLNVEVGEMVSWRNAGAALHTVTASDGDFDSGLLAAGETWSHRFTVPGRYTLLCSLHPQMTGELIVGSGSGQAPTATPTPTTTAMPSPEPQAPAPQGGSNARIVDFDFSPATLNVAVGTTVTWTNEGVALHTVTATDGSFDSGLMATGAAWSHTFEADGRYPVLCALHPLMVGEVVVTGGASPGDAVAAGSTGSDSGRGPAGTRAEFRTDSDAVPDARERAASVGDFFYDPEVVRAAVGEPLHWTNNGRIPHTVTALDGSFDSGILRGGESFTLRVDQPGEYAFTCTLHPDMIGTLVVTEAPADVATPMPAIAAVRDTGGGPGAGLAEPAPAASSSDGGAAAALIVAVVLGLLALVGTIVGYTAGVLSGQGHARSDSELSG